MKLLRNLLVFRLALFAICCIKVEFLSFFVFHLAQLIE